MTNATSHAAARGSHQAGAARTRLIILLVLVAASVGLLVFRTISTTTREDGLEAFRASDWDVVIDTFDRVLRVNPEDTEARYYRAIALSRKRRAREALEDMTLVRVVPEWEQRAFARSVMLHIQAGNVSGASKEIKTVAPEFLSNSLVHEAIGRFYLAAKQQHLDSAQRILESAMQRNQARAAFSRAERVVNADSKVFAASTNLLIDRLVENQGFEDTTSLREQIELGHAALVAAVASFEKAIRLTEQDPTLTEVPIARYELARVLEIRGRVADVERQRLKIRSTPTDRMQGDLWGENELDQTRGATTEDLAQAYVREKRYDEALSVIEEVPVNELGERTYALDMLQAVALDGLGRHDEMLAITQRWLKRSIGLSTMNFLRGRYYLDRGQHREALIWLERAVARNPGDIDYNEALAKCCTALAMDERATALYERLMDLVPTEHRYVIGLAEAMERLNWTDDARTLVLERLEEYFPIPSTPAHRELRRFLDEFLARYNLEPTNLFTAGQLWEEDPANYDVGRRLLGFYLDENLTDAARNLSRVLSTSCPSDHPAYFDVMMEVGRFFESVNRHDRAEEHYRKAAQGRPHDVRSYVARGRVQLASNRLGSVWRTLAKVDLLDPGAERAQELRFRLLVAEGSTVEAAALAKTLVSKHATDFEFIVEAAGVLIDAGDQATALKALRNLPALSRQSPEQRIEYALALVRAGDPTNGRNQILQAIELNPRRESIFVTAVDRLSQLGETDLLIQIVEPRLVRDPNIDTAPLERLAEAYLTKGRNNDFIDVMVNLFERGRRRVAYSWTSRFCNERGRLGEVMSIAEAAQTDRVATAEILGAAVDAALARGDQRRAMAFLRDLTALPSVDEDAIILVRARVTDLGGNMVGALDMLRKGLEKLQPIKRAARRRAIIEILGRRGQIEDVLAVMGAAHADGDDAGLWRVAARHLVRHDNIAALALIDEGLRRDIGDAHLLLDRGLLATGLGLPGDTLEMFHEAFVAAPDIETGRALAIRAAMEEDAERRNDRMALVRKTLDDEGREAAQAVFQSVRRLLTLSPKFVNDWIDDWLAGMDFPTLAEKRLARALVVDSMGDPDKTARLRELYPKIMILSGFEQTASQAHLAIRKLAESIPGHETCFSIMSARALMRSPATFDRGIELVSRVLAESEVKNEAALLIYGQTYLRSGQTKELANLIEYIQRTPTFESRFYEDMADILIAAGLPLEAATLLYQSPSKEVSKSIKEALALYRADRLDRAAALLVESVPLDQVDATYCQIVGDFLSKRDETLEAGYDLVRQAVYKYRSEDPSALLTLARVAMKVGDTLEARKNIRKYVSRDPASAQAVAAAFAVVEAFGAEYLGLAEWLEGRRAVLDPAGYVVASSR